MRTSLPILDQLQRERHLQSPQDIYHIIAGKTLKLLKLTIAMLSPEGERNFIEEWKSFEYPQQWSKLLNPISHLESFMMSDRIRLGMVMPFILNRSLTINCLKKQKIDKLQERTKLNRNQVINTIVKCWAIVAKCSRLAFKISLTIDDCIELERYLKKEREALVEVKLVYICISYINYVDIVKFQMRLAYRSENTEVTLCCKSQELDYIFEPKKQHFLR